MMGLPEGEDPGELVMTEEHGEHTHTVILLHAEGSAAEAHSRLYRRFGEIGVHCRFVFPRAPQRKLTGVPGGPEVVCWMMPKDMSAPPGNAGSMPAQYGYDAMLAAGQLGAQVRGLCTKQLLCPACMCSPRRLLFPHRRAGCMLSSTARSRCSAATRRGSSSAARRKAACSRCMWQ